MEELEPRDEADIIEIVSAALAGGSALEVMGAASKRQLGRPVEAERRLTTRALTGVRMYEAEELVMTAGPGTPMREIKLLLDQQGQQLAFEPVDFHRIYGTEALSGTIAGAFAAGASGSRRITAGAARDHLLGFRAISGRGELFKSGGRVIKNVTGYDLSKLMCGSYGTLAVLSEVTFKVMPKPETEQSVVIKGMDDAAAVRVMCEASGLPFEVSCLAHLPAECALAGDGTIAGGDMITDGGNAATFESATLLRLEGPEISVVSRVQDVMAHFKSLGVEMAMLDAATSAMAWQDLREGAPLVSADRFNDAQVWRLSTAPSHGARVVAAIRDAGVPLLRRFYDWAGGLIWLAVDGTQPIDGTTPVEDAHATTIRIALQEAGGHATLIRAATPLRAAIPVFHPQAKALAALSSRVKDSFDPKHILNPGRLVAGQ